MSNVLNLRQRRTERAVLVGVKVKGSAAEELNAVEPLQELRLLAEAAGAEVIQEILHSRSTIDSTYYIGTGLVEELALLAQDLSLDVAIFDNELSGTQLKNLEKRLDLKVVDRTGLILDIFAQRAKSKEGKLQVELAQLQYLLPRLTGSGSEMSRLAGGIGTRGPGETKLEKDKRLIRKRIRNIKNQLQEIHRQRAVIKSGRKPKVPLIALVGYTNSGKSTLRYSLLAAAAEKRVNWENEDPGTNQLFATLDPTVRGLELPNGERALVADTVGFIQNLPHQLLSSFQATLEEVQQADLLLHVVDASSPCYYQQMRAVEQVLKELNVLDKKIIVVFNKLDLLRGEADLLLASQYPTVAISALGGQGIQDLLHLISQVLVPLRKEVSLALPHDQAKLLAAIYNQAVVQEINYRLDHIYLRISADDALCTKLNQFVL